MENIIYSMPLEEFKTVLKKCIREEMTISKPEGKQEDLIRISDAVRLLKVSKITLYKWRKAGIIPYHRIASRIYFKRSELIEALRSSEKLGKNK
jgi:excisionase family DNA binding protein